VVQAIAWLDEDPSGLSLLDATLALIRTQYRKPQPTGQIGDILHGPLVVAGAELAQQLYTALYPLTEGI
jgi:hypothetical protein